MTMSTVRLRAMTDEDLPRVLDLLAAALADGPTGARTTDFFAWKHRDNPAGASYAFVAEDGERLLGVRLLMRWRFRLGDGAVSAVRAVDTATHPQAQGRGLFRRLTLAALEQIDADGVGLVFNTPNASSRPGYLKMGWMPAGEVPVAVRPVRPVRFVRGLAGGVGQTGVSGRPRPVPSPLPRAAQVLADHEQEVDALLSAAQAGAGSRQLTTDRTPRYLRWRYADPPGLDYRAIPIQRDGRLVGLGLGRLRRRGPLAELTLGEVLTESGDRDAIRQVLRGAIRSGADHVAACLPLHTNLAAAGSRAGFLRVPRRGLTMVVNQRRPLGVDATHLSSWRFALGDLELF